MDYFTKWIEVEALSNIQGVVNFLWKNIVCWFSLPKEIITDYRRQLTGSKLKIFMQRYTVKLCHSFLYYP